MSTSKTNAATGTDWTELLADPELAENLAQLLQVFRDAPPENRDEALLAAMRKIKNKTFDTNPKSIKEAAGTYGETRVLPASTTPPFEPDLFTPNPNQDRRRHPRIRCFVAVELRVGDSDAPIWGNLSNTSMGGCQVETASQISNGAPVEIGLWVASGKIWVKGFALNGVVVRSARETGVRVRFAAMAAAEKQSLRQFLKYVQETTKAAKSENSYLQLLKT
jgi:hypothetical protein